jgi:hypothetical protein
MCTNLNFHGAPHPRKILTSARTDAKFFAMMKTIINKDLTYVSVNK